MAGACNFYVPTTSDVIVGKGGYGTIYNTPGKSCVVKLSHHPMPCNQLRHEYDMTVHLGEALVNNLTRSERDFIGIINPSKLGLCGGQCCFSMQYLKPLSSRDKFVTQAYLALPSHSKLLMDRNQARGMYRGARQLANVLKEFRIDLEHIARHVGIAMAVMHYAAQLSGMDTEIVIAFTGTSVRPKIFIIDHDRNTRISLAKNKIPSTVSLLSSIIGTGEPYFPLQGPLSKPFKEGYLKKAAQLGCGVVAMDVLTMATEESVFSPQLPL